MKFGMEMRLSIRGGGKTVWGIYRIISDSGMHFISDYGGSYS